MVMPYPNCRLWSERFKIDGFVDNNKERLGGPKQVENSELLNILRLIGRKPKSKSQRTCNSLAIDEPTGFRRLQAKEKIQTEEKWLLYEWTEDAISNRSIACQSKKVGKWVNDSMAAKAISFFRHGVAMLQGRWEQVLENGGIIIVAIFLNKCLEKIIKI